MWIHVQVSSDWRQQKENSNPFTLHRHHEKALERITIPSVQLWKANLAEELYNEHRHQLWQSRFGKRSYPYLQALSNTLGCSSGNTVSGATWALEDLGMKPRWPQGSRGSCPLGGESISKASAATKGDRELELATKSWASHTWSTMGRRKKILPETNKNTIYFRPAPPNQYQIKKLEVVSEYPFKRVHFYV